MIQMEARPTGGEAVRSAGSSRRPIRIVAPTASGRRWRTARRLIWPGHDALAGAGGPAHGRVCRSAFEPR